MIFSLGLNGKYAFFDSETTFYCLEGNTHSYSIELQAWDVSGSTTIDYQLLSLSNSNLSSSVSMSNNGAVTCDGNFAGEQVYRYDVRSNGVSIAERKITVITKNWSSIQGCTTW